MSRLSEKYKVPEPTIKNMIQDGVIACSWELREEVAKLHAEHKSIDDISASCRISRRRVFQILREVK